MDHDQEQGILSKVDQSVPHRVAKDKITNQMTLKTSQKQKQLRPDSFAKFQRWSGSVRSDVEQQPRGSNISDRIRHRESMLRRHEQWLSTRRILKTGSSWSIIPSRQTIMSHQSITKQSPSGYNVQDSNTVKEEEPNEESTPLIRHPSLPSPSPLLAMQRSSDSSCSKSQSSRITQQEQHQLQQQSPHLISDHWATIKRQIAQGTFLVPELLSKESGLLDMDRVATASEEAYTGSTKTIEELRHQAIENFQKGSTFSPHLCLLAIFLYIIIAVLMFCFVLEPQWTIIDSCYFAVSTFTTLGYGDLSPTTTVSVIFTTLYALAGVTCLGLALGILGSILLETKEDRHCHEKLASEYEALTMFDHDDHSSDYGYDSDGYFEPVSHDEDSGEIEKHPEITSLGQEKNTDKNVPFARTVENKKFDSEESKLDGGKSPSVPSAKLIYSRTTYGVGMARFIVLLSIAMIFAILIGYQSGWGFWNTFYYAVTTAATIGKKPASVPKSSAENQNFAFF
jgi:hypothetical protein